MDHLGLAETVDGFGQRVVIGIANTADTRLNAGLSQSFCVFDRQLLAGLNHLLQHPHDGGCNDKATKTDKY